MSWKMLSEEKPDDMQKVLVTDGKFRELATCVLMVHTSGDGKKHKLYQFCKSDKYINGVRYWMPYPKLPELK